MDNNFCWEMFYVSPHFVREEKIYLTFTIFEYFLFTNKFKFLSMCKTSFFFQDLNAYHTFS